jgi:DNA polymerase
MSRVLFWNSIHRYRNPDCILCPLHETDGNVCVMGRGRAWARIMLIGEAPGEAEARTGKPFMGAAGQLLDVFLTELRMKHMVYITNICKCRPPENRKPTEKERNTCTENYLNKEITLMRPAAVVLLGKTPIEHFFGKRPFERGRVYELYTNGYVVSFDKPRKDTGRTLEYRLIPTWHPAYLIHSHSAVAERQLREHLALAKDLAHADLY